MRSLHSVNTLPPPDDPPDPEGDLGGEFDGDARLPLRPVPDDPGDSTADRLRLLVEPMPAIVWTTDRELRFRSDLGSGLASFGLRSTPGTSLFDYYGTTDPEAVPIRAHQAA